MDEIDGICPGSCHFELVPDNDLNKKYNTDCYYKPKATFATNLIEHRIAEEYSNAIKTAMEEAMQETFDLINSDIPASSSVSTSLYWLH